MSVKKAQPNSFAQVGQIGLPGPQASSLTYFSAGETGGFVWATDFWWV